MSVLWHVWKDPESYPICCVCAQSSVLIYKHPNPHIFPESVRPSDEWLKERKLVVGIAHCILHPEHKTFCLFPAEWMETGKALYTDRELQEEFKKRWPTAYWNLRLYNT